MAPIRVLFVCMGNICRSPTAHAVFRTLVARRGLNGRVEVDSAGTHGHYHLGEPPDPRACRHAAARGYDLDGLKARRITPEDFQRFDLIVAMDRANHEHLQSLCPPALQGKLRRMMEFATRHRLEEVPDPYYGGPDGFEQVLDLLEDAAAGLLEELTRRLDPCPAELPR
jgi:protein-tyrosine phosphatase